MLIFGASMQGRHHLSLFKTESNNTIDPDWDRNEAQVLERNNVLLYLKYAASMLFIMSLSSEVDILF
jgi:hypothetical protein